MDVREFPCRRAPGRAARDAGGTPIPEGVSGVRGRGTKGRGLVVDPVLSGDGCT